MHEQTAGLVSAGTGLDTAKGEGVGEKVVEVGREGGRVGGGDREERRIEREER